MIWRFADLFQFPCQLARLMEDCDWECHHGKKNSRKASAGFLAGMKIHLSAAGSGCNSGRAAPQMEDCGCMVEREDYQEHKQVVDCCAMPSLTHSNKRPKNISMKILLGEDLELQWWMGYLMKLQRVLKGKKL